SERSRRARQASHRASARHDAGDSLHRASHLAGRRQWQRPRGRPLPAEAIQSAGASRHRRRAGRNRIVSRVIRSRWVLTAVLIVIGLVPVGILAYLSTNMAADALRHRVDESMQGSAAMSALYINEELRGLAEVDESFANRPFFVRALASGDSTRYDHRQIKQTLLELSHVRRGIGTAFVADSDGRLLDIVPATP